MKRILSVLVLVTAGSVLAEDVDFWGPDSSNATNVLTTVSASAETTVESRSFTQLFTEGIDFSSLPVGFLLFLM